MYSATDVEQFKADIAHFLSDPGYRDASNGLLPFAVNMVNARIGYLQLAGWTNSDIAPLLGADAPTFGMAAPAGASVTDDGVQYPVDQSNKTPVTATPVTTAPVTTAIAPSTIPVVGGLIDEVGSAAVQIPLVGGFINSISTSAGISPGILALLGLGIGLYAFGVFDSGGGRKR